jgi:hypothetical protein
MAHQTSVSRARSTSVWNSRPPALSIPSLPTILRSTAAPPSARTPLGPLQSATTSILLRALCEQTWTLVRVELPLQTESLRGIMLSVSWGASLRGTSKHSPTFAKRTTRTIARRVRRLAFPTTTRRNQATFLMLVMRRTNKSGCRTPVCATSSVVAMRRGKNDGSQALVVQYYINVGILKHIGTD